MLNALYTHNKNTPGFNGVINFVSKSFPKRVKDFVYRCKPERSRCSFQRVQIGDIMGISVRFPLCNELQFRMLDEAIRNRIDIIMHPIDYKKGFQTISFHVSKFDSKKIKDAFTELVQRHLRIKY